MICPGSRNWYAAEPDPCLSPELTLTEGIMGSWAWLPDVWAQLPQWHQHLWSGLASPVSLTLWSCVLQGVSILDGILLVQSPSPEGSYLNPVCSRKNRLASHVSGNSAHLLPGLATHASCCGFLTSSRPQLCYQIWKKCTEGQCVEKQHEACRVGYKTGISMAGGLRDA